MTEVLSQDEVMQILSAINAGDSEPEELRPAPAARARKIKIYDFKRPDKFSKVQIRTTALIHEIFSRLITKRLSAMLRSMVHVHVASVDQLTFEEFIRSIPSPTTMGIIEMAPLPGSALLEIDPAISIAMTDRLMGGTGESTEYRHELTIIERTIMEELINRLSGDLRNAWMQVTDLSPRLSRIETNPQLAQTVPFNEMTVLVTMETKIGEVEGMINICVPYTTLEPIMGNLTSNSRNGKNRQAAQPSYQLNSRVDVPITLTAEALRRGYSIQEISGWKKGTVLMPLSSAPPHSCFLSMGDSPVWRCELLVETKGFRKSIKITDSIDVLYGTEGVKNMDNDNPTAANALQSVKMNITVELGATSLTVKEVFGMGKDSILELDKLAGEALDVKANGVLIAKGEAVVIDDNFGVRITEIINPPSTDQET